MRLSGTLRALGDLRLKRDVAEADVPKNIFYQEVGTFCLHQKGTDVLLLVLEYKISLSR